MSSTKTTSKCYAAQLGDCTGSISKEHFISQAILKHLVKGNKFSISGFSRSNLDTVYSKNPLLMAANILCKKHNSDLSDVDAEMLSFFNAVEHLRLTPAGTLHEIKLDGKLIERWVLKLIVGFAIAGHAAKGATRVLLQEPSREWLEMLFGKKLFPDMLGLYAAPKAGMLMDADQAAINNELLFAPLIDENVLTGAMIRLFGVPFILVMAMPSQEAPGLLEGAVLRPKAIKMDLTNGCTLTVNFGYW